VKNYFNITGKTVRDIHLINLYMIPLKLIQYIQHSLTHMTMSDKVVRLTLSASMVWCINQLQLLAVSSSYDHQGVARRKF